MRNTKLYFILHWIGIVGLLGLIVTAFGGAVFFSKEAIMQSFGYSLPALHINISPVNQLFIAKIERRFNWDWHFYSGMLFGFSMFLFLTIHILKKNKLKLLHIGIIICIGFVFISGSRLYGRLWIPLSDDFFYYLKIFHRYSVYTLVFLTGLHVLQKIKIQITGEENV